ncbi:hypothetical protein IGI04_040118 [Brassica rapa subsp. trilocularis]|uniref:Uncharacterized protein n=1 Tax=Brassica rapa subsp. trilocularis TaxID=1813537 RepID=A0ABQ7KNJ2_BRACM|nr:hypothetical protein IGI04_040118 [Brassica rapa subsp. trilocularis]
MSASKRRRFRRTFKFLVYYHKVPDIDETRASLIQSRERTRTSSVNGRAESVVDPSRQTAELNLAVDPARPFRRDDH